MAESDHGDDGAEDQDDDEPIVILTQPRGPTTITSEVAEEG